MAERGEREVVEAIRTAGHKLAVNRFERLTETAEAAAGELGVDVERIVKSLVVSSGNEPVVALLPGDRRADMKAVARVLGAKKIRMADPDLVLRWTGFPVGAVPPLGHARKIIVLMDDKIPVDGFIYPAAGEKNNVFETTFEDLLAMTGAKVCKISKND
jgi:Cys-tRNA(Pro) deacylase